MEEAEQNGNPVSGCPRCLRSGGFPLFWGDILSTKDEVPSLGIPLDPVLAMESQRASVAHSAYFHLRQIAQLCPYLDTESLTTLVPELVVLR